MTLTCTFRFIWRAGWADAALDTIAVTFYDEWQNAELVVRTDTEVAYFLSEVIAAWVWNYAVNVPRIRAHRKGVFAIFHLKYRKQNPMKLSCC